MTSPITTAKKSAAMTPARAVRDVNLRNAMENNMENLEERIQKIEERNLRVEADKTWEQSWTRRALLAIFSYVAVGAYLQAIQIPRPWINAIVPAAAFMIQTLTLPFFKKLWSKLRNKQLNDLKFYRQYSIGSYILDFYCPKKRLA